jgi:alpha-glucosidase
MHWQNGAGGGFTDPEVTPWLPLGDTACNVEDQRADPRSMLSLGRDLLALRRRTPDLQTGAYLALAAPEGVWAWRRGAHHVIAVSCSERDATVDGIDGRVVIGTNRSRDGESVAGSLLLRPHEALVVAGLGAR